MWVKLFVPRNLTRVEEIVVRTNHLTGWGKKKEAKWLARTLKTEVAFFFVSESRKKEISFEDRGRRERTSESHAKLRAKKQSRVFSEQQLML